MTNEEKAIELATDSKGNILAYAHMAALEMSLWKEEQYLENVEDDAKSYANGVAKANPGIDEWVLNFIETAYIAGRNRIK